MVSLTLSRCRRFGQIDAEAVAAAMLTASHLCGGEASAPRMAEEQLTAPAFGQAAMPCKVLIG
jgi:hypothetical protein